MENEIPVVVNGLKGYKAIMMDGIMGLPFYNKRGDMVHFHEIDMNKCRSDGRGGYVYEGMSVRGEVGRKPAGLASLAKKFFLDGRKKLIAVFRK